MKKVTMYTGSPCSFCEAAKALLKNTQMNAKDIAIESLNIAADICIYTNHNIISETIEL